MEVDWALPWRANIFGLEHFDTFRDIKKYLNRLLFILAAVAIIPGVFGGWKYIYYYQKTQEYLAWQTKWDIRGYEINHHNVTQRDKAKSAHDPPPPMYRTQKGKQAMGAIAGGMLNFILFLMLFHVVKCVGLQAALLFHRHDISEKEQAKTVQENPNIQIEIIDLLNKHKETLINSSDPNKRIQAINWLLLNDFKNENLRKIIITEFIETLKNDLRGEVALAAAFALACIHNAKD